MFAANSSPSIPRSAYAGYAHLGSIPTAGVSGFQPATQDWTAVTSIEHILKLANENEQLRGTNIQLGKQIGELTSRLSHGRTEPVQVEVSPQLSIRLSRAEHERDRLQLLLKEKIEQLEELKLLKSARVEKAEVSIEDLIQSARVEIEAQLAEEFKLRQQKVQEQLDIMQIELNEQKLLVHSKNKELELMDTSMRNLERKCLDDMESLRQSISQGLWAEYDKKLDAKKEEYELRLTKLEQENERLSNQTQEWRRKCIESEERITSMLAHQEQSSESKELRKLIVNYENQISSLERELERVNQLHSESLAHSSVSSQKVRYLEDSLTDLENRRLTFDSSLMEKDGKIKALSKEVERLSSETVNWRNQYDKAEKEAARLKTELSHTKIQTASALPMNVQSRELQLERSEREKVQAELNSTQAQLITVLQSKKFAEQQIENLVQESAAKSSAIQALKDHLAVKIQGGSTQEPANLAFMLAGVNKILSSVPTTPAALQNLEFGERTLGSGLRDSGSMAPANQIFKTQLEVTSVQLATENQTLKATIASKDEEIRGLKHKLAETAAATAEVLKNGQSLAAAFQEAQSQAEQLTADNKRVQDHVKEKDDIIALLEAKLADVGPAAPKDSEWQSKMVDLQRAFDAQLKEKDEELQRFTSVFNADIELKSKQFDEIKDQFVQGAKDMKLIIQTLETQLEQAKSQGSASVQDLVLEISKLQEENRTLASKLDQCQTEKTAIEESFRHMEDQSQRAIFETQRDSSTQANLLQDALDKAKEEAGSEIKLKAATIEGLQSQLDSALMKASEARSSLELANNLANTLEKGLADLQKQCSLKDDRIKQQDSKITELELLLQQPKPATRDETPEVAAIQVQVEDSRIQELVATATTLSEQSASLQLEVARLTALNTQLLEEIKELTTQKRVLEDDVITLTKELNIQRAATEMLPAQPAPENANLALVEEYEIKLEHVVRELENIQNHRDELNNDNLMLAETVQKLQQHIAVLSQPSGSGDGSQENPHLAHLQIQEQLEEENQRLAFELQDCLNVNQGLALQNAELQQQVTDYDLVVRGCGRCCRETSRCRLIRERR